MSDPQTFADLLEQFNEKYAEFQDDFWDGYNKIVDMLNSAAHSFGQFLDDILPGENEVEHAIDKWNNEIEPALSNGMREIQEKLQEAVNKLAGNPGNLQIWAENFVEAQGIIFKQRNEVEVAADVTGAWTGAAFDKYNAVSGVQLAHLEKLGEALRGGRQAHQRRRPEDPRALAQAALRVRVLRHRRPRDPCERDRRVEGPLLRGTHGHRGDRQGVAEGREHHRHPAGVHERPGDDRRHQLRRRRRTPPVASRTTSGRRSPRAPATP